MSDIVSIFYPENRAGGFSRCDGTVQFYQRVHALLRPDYVVLDFGAGRGAAYYQDPSFYRKNLRNLRGERRRVVGVDVDPVVSTNPYIDEAVVIDAASPLPFPKDTFDLIVSDSTFEHVSDATRIAYELDRVLKVGGWICARTPNRNGYVALMNRIVPASVARRLVSLAQPDRKVEDIFPAYYRMNTLRNLNMLFPADRYEHMSFAFDSEPRYHFNQRGIFLPASCTAQPYAARSEKYTDVLHAQTELKVSARDRPVGIVTRRGQALHADEHRVAYLSWNALDGIQSAPGPLCRSEGERVSARSQTTGIIDSNGAHEALTSS
jgi:SAM-dependent methyltransferase